MPLIETVADALRLMIPESKSLRDRSTTGQYIEGNRGNVAIIHAGSYNGKEAFKKQRVNVCRSWAEHSWTVRTAIDIHRNFAALVVPDVTPIDHKRPVDSGIQRDLEDLLSQQMSNGDSYSETKEQFLEDYFVVSHGVAELWLKKNGKPYNITSLDAARIAFFTKWNGKADEPRYAELDGAGKIIRQFGDQNIMCMVNRKRSYDTLGLSHVEMLETAVQAIFAGDEHLLQELRYPSASGALSLGEGVGPAVADEVRAKIMAAAKHAFVVITGTKNPKFIEFKPRDLKRLDKQLWFVKEVAAIFGLPISVFAQSADQNRSNVVALLDQMGEGLKDTIIRVKAVENSSLVLKYGDPRKHNLQIDYPVLKRKDAYKQAQLTALQLADQPFITINEARMDNGQEKLELPIADEILYNTSIGVVPLRALNNELYGDDASLDSEKLQRYIKGLVLARRKRLPPADVDGEIITD